MINNNNSSNSEVIDVKDNTGCPAKKYIQLKMFIYEKV